MIEKTELRRGAQTASCCARHEEEDSVSVYWSGQKCKADESKNAWICYKWASNCKSVISLSQ